MRASEAALEPLDLDFGGVGPLGPGGNSSGRSGSGRDGLVRSGGRGGGSGRAGPASLGRTSTKRRVDHPLDAVEVRRSPRRRRTVSAYRDGERTIVLIPGRFTAAEERHWVETMLARLDAGDRRRRPGDAQLAERARRLSERYLGAAAVPSAVTWAPDQRSRWGSCTPADRTIRISSRLQGMPGWVLDYVLLHELAHLVHAAHDAAFWGLLEAYPRTERARGYLEGVAAASGLRVAPDTD